MLRDGKIKNGVWQSGKMIKCFDDTEKEIEGVEDEVEELEDDSYPEQFDAETQIKTKTQEIMQLMETINDNNNEIVR